VRARFFCEGGKSIAIDSKINYLTKINYHVRERSGRPKGDVGISVNLPSWLELRVPMITDDIREFGTRHHVWSTGSELGEVYSPCVNKLYDLRGLFFVTCCLFVVFVCPVDSSD
jgi:hypothetical protein